MKYIKSDNTDSLSDLKMVKMRLICEEPPHERLWVKITSDGKYAILCNDALEFLPYTSWGTMWEIKGDTIKPGTFMYEDKPLVYHPEAWESGVQNGIIDEEGNVLRTMKY